MRGSNELGKLLLQTVCPYKPFSSIALLGTRIIFLSYSQKTQGTYCLIVLSES